MSTKVETITNIIESLAPLKYAYKWDNVGLQIGSKNQEIKRILTTLEITNEVLNEAIEKEVDMIIAHHPIIFSPLKNIIKEDIKGELIYKAIKNNISIYIAHTNIDIAPNGLNDYIAGLLNINKTEILEITQENSEICIMENKETAIGIGRVGELRETKTLKELVKEIKENISIKHIKVVGNLKTKIKKVAVINGSGADFIKIANSKGCQCVITGDVKYHDAQDALSAGITVIDMGHYHSEKHFINFIADYLRKESKKKGIEIDIIETNIDINPFQII